MSAQRERSPMRRLLIAVSVVHPVPSAINGILVATLALIAGGGHVTAASLGVAMIGFQFSIGALNDIVDAGTDGDREPPKPIPAGLVAVPTAAAIVVIGAAVGLVVSASLGLVVLVFGALGYGVGVAYDLGMRRRGFGWLCYAAAFPLLLTWTWMAAAMSLPPGWPLLLPVAALAGPALHLANSLVDIDVDMRAGRRSLATRLGPRLAQRVLATLMASILVLAWATILLLQADTPPAIMAALTIATVATLAGVALSWQPRGQVREAGWLLQAGGLAMVAGAWLASVVAG